MTIKEKCYFKNSTVCCAVYYGSCIAFPDCLLSVGILANTGGSVPEHVSVFF